MIVKLEIFVFGVEDVCLGVVSWGHRFSWEGVWLLCVEVRGEGGSRVALVRLFGCLGTYNC